MNRLVATLALLLVTLSPSALQAKVLPYSFPPEFPTSDAYKATVNNTPIPALQTERCRPGGDRQIDVDRFVGFNIAIPRHEDGYLLFVDKGIRECDLTRRRNIIAPSDCGAILRRPTQRNGT